MIINISGLDKYEVFMALFNNALPLSRSINITEAREIYDNYGPCFDFFMGKNLHFSLRGENVNFESYDDYNGGIGTAEIALKPLLNSKDKNKYLFIGGPLDGSRINTGGASEYHVAIPIRHKIEFSEKGVVPSVLEKSCDKYVYILREKGYPPINFYTEQEFTLNEVMIKLMDGYKKNP